jgi:Lrp/AsnC family leucine-responsive transcriptional regulator
LEKQAEAYSKRFETAMLGRTEVIDCCFVTGDFDYLIKVAVADLDEFHRFLTQVLTRIVGVANTRTIIPVKRIGAVREVVGIGRGAFSGNMKVSFQAARSIG